MVLHAAVLVAFAAAGAYAATRTFRQKLVRDDRPPLTPPLLFSGRRAGLLIERNIYVYRCTWMVIFSGFFEPLFYLLGIGFGLGALIEDAPGPAAAR